MNRIDRRNAIAPEVAIERLTSLWALNEAALGGLVHILKIPFTGIAVVSIAITLIALIAYFAERKAAAIIKATIIVLLIKAAASPHTPLTAYAAVAFQGLLGSVIFGYIPHPRVAALLLGLLALWEGAIQKLAVLTILYGKPLWESVDAAGHWTLNQIGAGHSALSPTAWVLAAYFSYYTLGGLMVGWLAGVLPGEIEQGLKHASTSISSETRHLVPTETATSRRRINWFLRIAIMLCLLGAVLILSNPDSEGFERAARILVRALIVVAIWIFAARPVIKKLLAKFRRREQGHYGEEVARAMDQMPELRAIAVTVWKETSTTRGFGRWRQFLARLVVMALTAHIESADNADLRR